jgi:chromosome partitioning protein
VKKLVITTEKGGVGKTALTTQLALYLALRLHQRVLVMDLDVQNNLSSTLTKQGGARLAPFTAYDVLTGPVEGIPDAPFVLVREGSRETLGLESRASEHQSFADHLVTFFDSVDARFDVCLVDTGPRAEICHNLALITADYFLAPLVLSQHAIDGVADILYATPWGFEHIRAQINRELAFIGILPVMVEAKPVQRSILTLIESHPNISPFLLRFEDQNVARIPRLQAIEEAQNVGAFVADLDKTSARDAWRQIKPAFDAIVRAIQLEPRT